MSAECVGSYVEDDCRKSSRIDGRISVETVCDSVCLEMAVFGIQNGMCKCHDSSRRSITLLLNREMIYYH